MDSFSDDTDSYSVQMPIPFLVNFMKLDQQYKKKMALYRSDQVNTYRDLNFESDDKNGKLYIKIAIKLLSKVPLTR